MAHLTLIAKINKPVYKSVPTPLLQANLSYRKIEGKMKILQTMKSYPELYNFIVAPTKEYEAPVPDYGEQLTCNRASWKLWLWIK